MTNVLHTEFPEVSEEDRRDNIVVFMNNFMTYHKSRVKIPKNSMTLINGPSGAGKTSILEAFMFVLYNTVKKPSKFGTKKCSVWLFVGDFVAYRQHAPKLLKVWNAGEFIQEEAQQQINARFGIKEVFTAASYMPQGMLSPFLGSNDSVKLEIIREIAFRGGEGADLKEPISLKLEELKKRVIGITAQLELSVETIKRFDRENPSIVSIEKPNDTREAVNKAKVIRAQIEDIESRIEEAIRAETGISMFNSQIQESEELMSSLKEKIEAIDKESLDAELEDIELKLSEISKGEIDGEKMAAIQKYKIWEDLQRRNNERLESLQLKIGKISDELVQFFKLESIDIAHVRELSVKLSGVRQKLTESSILLEQIGCKTLEEAEEKLEEARVAMNEALAAEKEVTEKIALARLSNKMKCPHCNNGVIMSSDGRSLEKYASKSQGLSAMIGGGKEVEVPYIDVSYQDGIEASRSATEAREAFAKIETVVQTAREKSSIDSDINPSEAVKKIDVLERYIRLDSDIEDLLKQIEESKVNPPENIDIKESNAEEKKALEERRDEIRDTFVLYAKLQSSYESAKSKYSNFSSMLESLSVKTSSDELKKEKALLSQKVDLLLHLSSSSDLAARRSVLQNTMNEKAIEVKRIVKEKEACERLLKLAGKAERLFLQDIVDKINAIISQCLQNLFPDSAISVELSTTTPFKTKSGIRQRFNLKVFYNNTEYSSPNQLSGGERARVSLAITIALNKISGSPFLFLDETLSSLDTELKSEAAALLKKLSETKTCIVISHEETEGLYDNVLPLRRRAY